MIENCLLWREKAKKLGGKRRFSVGAAVPPPFLHSSMLFSTNATVVPNFRAVTLLKFYGLRLCVFYFWFQKVAHPPPPFFTDINNNNLIFKKNF